MDHGNLEKRKGATYGILDNNKTIALVLNFSQRIFLSVKYKLIKKKTKTAAMGIQAVVT